jgi:hypothetical protein
MNYSKILSITLLIIFSSLTSIAYAESLKFAASTYEGEVKKGKAHGVGIFTFSDGSTYEGKVKKNIINGKGKFTDAQGKIYEGKFKYGALKNKIDKKIRNVIKIKVKTGVENFIEMKGKGNLSSKWFEAKKNSSGTYELTDKGKKDMEIEKSQATAAASSSGSNC